MSRCRALLVEDNPQHVFLFDEAIRSANPDVVFFTNSTRQQFLDALTSQHFDCVVMDYKLGPVNAPDLIREADDLLFLEVLA